MSLRDIKLKKEYRTLKENIEQVFYAPVLREAVLYKRGVGFFSSSALVDISKGIYSLRKNNGHIELIVSPNLSEDDYEAIKLGYSTREMLVKQALLREMKEPLNLYEKFSLNLLANLIADGTMDIKIAIPVKKNAHGIYHEKVGIIIDTDNNRIAFSGSMNETKNAFADNYETIDVFTSWENDSDLERVNNKERAFDAIWNDEENTVATQDISAIKEEFIEKYKVNDIDFVNYVPPESQQELATASSPNSNNFPQIPVNIELDRTYQTIAIDQWRLNGYRGIFDMATGTGKTFTGLGAIVDLCRTLNNHVAIFIIVPYQHLVDQWVEDIERFNMKPIIAYSSSPQKNWKARLDKAIRDQNNFETKPFFCYVSTYATFVSEYVQKMISKIKAPIALVVDEAHNVGAQRYQKYLDDRFQYRLALSATIDRYGDEDGTNFLHTYFGKVCMHYDLERAINENKLTRYKYFPVLVYLNKAELFEYENLSYDMSKNLMVDEKGNTRLNHYGELLALKRARIVASAAGKIDALRTAIQPYKNENNILVYCGATTVNNEDATISSDGVRSDDDGDIRQIIEVSRILGNEMNMQTARFTSKEDAETRRNIKERFKNGDGLQAIVAIKCLDEGVNIPGIKTAFILASSTNPKEYIQRRGRVLRKAPNKEFAEIYDFVTLPRRLDTVSSLTEEEMKYDLSLVKNELRRMEEFSRLSMNQIDSQELKWKIQRTYNIEEEKGQDYE